MEDTKLKSQNRFLKIILLLLFIPIIAGASIAGYIYLPELISGTSEPWEKDSRSDKAKVSRSAPKADEPANTQPAANANTNIAASNANVAAANTNAAPPAQVKTNFPLAGRWLMTGPDKTTYVFSAPTTVGNTQTGTRKIILKEGKEYLSNYIVLSSSKLRMQSEDGSDEGEVTYSISAGGKSLEIHLNDGGVMYFTRR
ncbi:MAG: hypothetical protein IT173_03495 [Acidobacteria bacterium]|nr:hypothetical protein [Acidobacteriota bacterium]